MPPSFSPSEPGLAMLQAFFDGAASAVVGFSLIDQDLRFVAINETLAEINGYAVEDHPGRRIQELLPDLEPIVSPIYQQVFDTLTPITNIEVSGEVPSRPGLTRHWMVSYVPVQTTDQQVYVGSIVVEVTEQKQLIRRLEQLNNDLQRSNQELEQFARTASHDLREPLRTINSYAQLLDRRYGDRLEARGKRYLHHISNSAQRAQDLVQDLLTYARLDAHDKILTPIDLDQLLREVVYNFSLQIEQKNAQVRYEGLPTVIADRRQLYQVFYNLISNALKFSAPDLSPAVEIQTKQQDQYWQISVQDNGIGIAPDYCDRIFAVFQRLHLPEEFEGTGIGLSICQKIIEQHGGSIWVESTPGVGSTFYFTLPIAPAESVTPL